MPKLYRILWGFVNVSIIVFQRQKYKKEKIGERSDLWYLATTLPTGSLIKVFNI